MSHQLLRQRRGMGNPTVNGRQVNDILANLSCYNLGFSISSGTFTVHGSDGTALSASNPAWVCLPSKTAGRQVWVSITANQTFIDDVGSSTIIGNIFGLTTGIAHADPIPFYLYAVLDDAETAISFMISRFPNSQISPAAAKIGKTGSAVADSLGSFFALGNPTVADYESNPCLSIGSFRMTMSSSDDWTVQSLVAGQDGIGLFQENMFFSVSKSQFGAASTKWFRDNTGTAPDQTSGTFSYTYTIDHQNNAVTIIQNFASINVAGVGAVAAQLVLPYTCVGNYAMTFGQLNIASYFIVIGTTLASTSFVTFGFAGGTGAGAASGSLTNAAFTVAGLWNCTGQYNMAFI